jgi:hypothetical protein
LVWGLQVGDILGDLFDGICIPRFLTFE